MNRIELAAADGEMLAAYRFDPPGAAKASVVIAPAMAISQSFYANFAAWLAGQGYTVWTFDYRGTGESLRGSMPQEFGLERIGHSGFFRPQGEPALWPLVTAWFEKTMAGAAGSV